MDLTPSFFLNATEITGWGFGAWGYLCLRALKADLTHNKQREERFCGENERWGCLGSLGLRWIGSPLHAGGVSGSEDGAGADTEGYLDLDRGVRGRLRWWWRGLGSSPPLPP